jgi:hypothetical protein
MELAGSEDQERLPDQRRLCHVHHPRDAGRQLEDEQPDCAEGGSGARGGVRVPGREHGGRRTSTSTGETEFKIYF